MNPRNPGDSYRTTRLDGDQVMTGLTETNGSTPKTRVDMTSAASAAIDNVSTRDTTISMV